MQGRIEAIAATLPELPDVIQKRLETQYSLPPYEAEIIATTYGAAPYFEELANGRNALEAARWYCSYLSIRPVPILLSANILLL